MALREGWAALETPAGEEDQIDIVELLTSIRDRVFTKRIRVRDRFRDFDRLRCGRITKQQFFRVLQHLHPELDPKEAEAVAQHFTERGVKVRWPQVVNYVKFSEAVDLVFGPARDLEKTPTTKVLRTGALAPSTYGFTPHDVDDMERFHQVLKRIATLAETRGVELFRCFQRTSHAQTASVFPRGCGKLTRFVFMQRFPFVSEFSQEELDLLLDRYRTEHKGVHAYAFAREVADAIEERRLEREAAEAPPSPKFRAAPRGPPGDAPASMARTQSEASLLAQHLGGGRAPHAAPEVGPGTPRQRPASASCSRSTRSGSAASTARPIGSGRSSVASCGSAEEVARPAPPRLQRPASASCLRPGRAGPEAGAAPPLGSGRSVGSGGSAAARPPPPPRLQRPASATSVRLTRRSLEIVTREAGPGSVRSLTVTGSPAASLATPEASVASGPPPARTVGSARAPRPAACAGGAAPPSSVWAEKPKPKVRPFSAIAAQRKLAEVMPKPDLLTRLRNQIHHRSLRVAEHFRDFDRLRKGVCTPSHFKAVLSLLGIALDADALAALLEMYRSEDGDFRYPDFCADVEDVPHDATKPRVPLTAEERREFEDLKTTLAAAIRLRRMEVRSVFDGFRRLGDNTPPDHVTLPQLGRALSMLGFSLTEEQVHLLCKAYCDRADGACANYVELLADIDPAREGPDVSALVEAASAKRRYFDDRGRVVPRNRPQSAPCRRVKAF